jgi:endonuclease/exonuclease/phosphatase (EEP) superfamily protein YafD
MVMGPTKLGNRRAAACSGVVGTLYAMRRLVAWLLVGACAAWVVVRVLGLERGFPLVPLLAFTPLAALAAVVVVAVALLLRQRAAALAAAVLAAVLVVSVAPRALGGPSDAAGPRLTVVSANMRFGGASAEALVALVRRSRADVLSVQELTPSLVQELDAAGLAELLPERVLDARPRGQGIGLFSRLPLAPGSAPGERRNPLAVASAQVPGGPAVELVAVHVPPPLRPPRLDWWHDDMRALPAATPDGTVRILAGDFNATLDHAELRRVLDSGYEDAAAEVGAGLKATWPDGRRFPPPVAIDHVLADERLGVRAFSVHPIPGTDHRAVVAELVLPR